MPIPESKRPGKAGPFLKSDQMIRSEVAADRHCPTVEIVVGSRCYASNAVARKTTSVQEPACAVNFTRKVGCLDVEARSCSRIPVQTNHPLVGITFTTGSLNGCVTVACTFRISITSQELNFTQSGPSGKQPARLTPG